MTTVLAESRPVARKAHVCGCCGLSIEAGTVYLNQRCAGYGQAWTFKAHPACDAFYWKLHREWFLCDDDTIEPSEFLEALADALAEKAA